MKQVALMTLALTCFELTSCGTITVKGRVAGLAGARSVEAQSIVLERGNAPSTLRLVENAGRDETELLSDVIGNMLVTISGNPSDLNERYHLFCILEKEGTFAGGTSNDRSFVVNHFGEAIHLSLRNNPGSSNEIAPGASRRHVGTTMVAIERDGNRVVPWMVRPDDDRCFALGGNDCFDMETLSRELFRGISDAVRANADVVTDTLNYVPRVVHRGFERGTDHPRARGFGFIYHAVIQVPLASIDVYAPISILFLMNPNQYLLAVDPLSLLGPLSEPPENLDRVYVHGTLGANLFEGVIRDQIVAGIRTATLPELIRGAAFEDSLLVAIDATAGPITLHNHLPYSQYEAILLPESNSPSVHSMRVWSRNRDGDITEGTQIRLVFLE